IAMTLDLDPRLRMRLQPGGIGFQHGAVLLLNRVLVVREVNVAERTLRAEFSALPVLERVAAALVNPIFTKLASAGIGIAAYRGRLLRRASGQRQHHRNTHNRSSSGDRRTTIHPTTPTTLDRNHYHYPPSKRK